MRTESEAEAHVRMKVQEDPEFRNSLVRDPRAVILAETGVDLSDEKLVFVSEEIRKGIIASGDSNGPLSSKELEQISGGNGTWVENTPYGGSVQGTRS